MSQALDRWFSEVASPGWIWYAKRLAANDTLATGGHQAGPYIPRLVFGMLFPSILSSTELNPSRRFEATIATEGQTRTPRAIWYNNRIVAAGTRNECRVTGWGGGASPLLDPESTGALCIFAFRRGTSGDMEDCRIWICSSPSEEDFAATWLGLVEPGAGVLLSPDGSQLLDPMLGEVGEDCGFQPAMLPEHWQSIFPTASDIVRLAMEACPAARKAVPDVRLLVRRDCEYRIFRYVEQAHVLPRAREGFDSVESFIGMANAVANRRKARSGASLELQTRAVFVEEHLQFSHDAVSENNKRPDFMFPSEASYHDGTWPASRLRMLGVKTTCKDRWRQVLDEAERIPVKHLLTLQEGVSESQFGQMKAAGLRLVVPSPLHRKYPGAIRGELMSLEGFIQETGAVCGTSGA